MVRIDQLYLGRGLFQLIEITAEGFGVLEENLQHKHKVSRE